MDYNIYFGEYTLSEDTEMKLKNIEHLLLKQNIPPSNSAWSTLFNIEESKHISQEETNISMEVEENNTTDNSSQQDDHQESMITSQFNMTQIETKKIDIVLKEIVNNNCQSELINVVESLYEILEDNNRTLEPEELKNLRHFDIDEIMERLSKLLSVNGVYNICDSLCCVEMDTAMQYIKAVCTKILLQTIIQLEKQQPAIKMISVVLGRMTVKFPDEIHKWIFIPIINTGIRDTTVISTIIKCYTGPQKLTLISDFLINVRELQMWHLTILILIMDIKIDDNMKDRLLTILVEKALILSKDKNYSKFMLSFIKSNSPFSITQKRMLDEIVAVNETIFKTSMKQILHNM